MIRGFSKFVGKFALLSAGMAFLTAVSLFLLGSFLLTWPVLRMTPRDRRVRAAVDLLSAGMTAMQVFGGSDDVTSS